MSGTVSDDMAELIQSERCRDLDTVVDSQDRKVTPDGQSLRVNLPAFARRLHSIEEGDEVTVHTTDQDCLIIEL